MSHGGAARKSTAWTPWARSALILDHAGLMSEHMMPAVTQPVLSRRQQRAGAAGRIQSAKPPRVTGRPLRRRMQRARIPLAIILAVSAGGLAWYNGMGSSVDRVPAVRVTTDVGAGETLTAQSVEVAEVDVAAVPESHSGDPGRYVGETLSGPLPRGAVVPEPQRGGPGLLTGREDGTVAVPVRPADTAIVGLLTPGQHVDVLVSTDAPERASATRTVAAGVPVLWTPLAGGDENWLGERPAADSRDVVVLAVQAQTAEDIAQATHEGRVHLSLVPDATRTASTSSPP